MLMRPWSAAALILIPLFAVWIGLTCARAGAATPLPDLLITNDECRPPCFMGIRPGSTQVLRAWGLLEDHPWVGQTRSAATTDFTIGYLEWSWSGTQPDYIDSSAPGRASYEFGFIRAIEIKTRVPFGDVWHAVGEPGLGVRFADGASRLYLLHIAYYAPGTPRYITYLPCPVHARAFWSAPVTVALSAYAPSELGLYQAYRLPTWGACA